jgi:hypothetical protein
MILRTKYNIDNKSLTWIVNRNKGIAGVYANADKDSALIRKLDSSLALTQSNTKVGFGLARKAIA